MIRTISKKILNIEIPTIEGTGVLNLSSPTNKHSKNNLLVSLLESQHHTTIAEMVVVPVLVILSAISFLYALDKYNITSIDFV